MHPYFNNRRINTQLMVICGRCESEFFVNLKKRKDHPRVLCPKCKVENQLKIVWK